MTPKPAPGFYVHKERKINSHQISVIASEIAGPSSVQWVTRSAPCPSTISVEKVAETFYTNYPTRLDDLDDVVPPLPIFDDSASAHFLKAGIPGITVKHVPKRYINSVRILCAL